MQELESKGLQSLEIDVDNSPYSHGNICWTEGEIIEVFPSFCSILDQNTPV